MLHRCLCLGLISAMIFSSTVFATERNNENWIVKGSTKIVKADEKVNINPYNLAKIIGVGEENKFHLVDTYESFDIPLNAPLYSLSENYSDKILYKEGLWGVERLVAVKVFDGSEDWRLLESPGYKNNNTTIFACSNTIPTVLWDGISTHFDVFTKEAQKNNRYDGISFGKNTDEFYMRIMNVRNVTTVEGLKTYLKAQYDANTPVKFLFALKEPYFEPFDEDMQNKMNSADLSQLGFVDKSLDKISKQQNAIVDGDIFSTLPENNADMLDFMSSIVDIKIYNSPQASYYIEGIYPRNDGFVLRINDSNGASYEGMLLTEKASFTVEKPAEIMLKNKEDSNTSIRVLMNLSKAKFPNREMSGFTALETLINDTCVVDTELLMPKYMPVVNGLPLNLYVKNSLLFAGNVENAVESEALPEGVELANNILTVLGLSQQENVSLKLNVDEKTTTMLPVAKEAGAGKTQTVLFFGDSIINQDLYTLSVAQRFVGDDMKLELIGTRGTEGNRHEGRGGFAAYDYCNLSTKFGYDNPFFNNGKFDFSYYMNKNKFENLDTVVINLGVNDLNLIGHNSHDEILSYFDEIMKSIHDYDSNIVILLNSPTVLFADESTNTAKDQRLSFIKTLQKNYEGREKENIYLLPTYLGVDPLMGFKRIEPVIDEFNQDHSLIVTDTTHPNNMGYGALADITYSYLKFIGESHLGE